MQFDLAITSTVALERDPATQVFGKIYTMDRTFWNQHKYAGNLNEMENVKVNMSQTANGFIGMSFASSPVTTLVSTGTMPFVGGFITQTGTAADNMETKFTDGYGNVTTFMTGVAHAAVKVIAATIKAF